MHFVHNDSGHIKLAPNTYQLRKGEVENNLIASDFEVRCFI